MEVYSKVLQLTLDCEYYGDDGTTFVTVIPTPEWADRFSKLGVVVKSTGNGIILLATDQALESLDRWAVDHPNLLLEVKSLDPGFKNLIQVTPFTNQETIWYRWQDSIIHKMEVIPIRKSLFPIFQNSPESKLQDEGGLDILSDTRLRPGDRGFHHLLASFPDGKYVLEGEAFFYVKGGLQSGHFSMISVHLKEWLAQENPVSIKLSLPVREVYLKYWIGSNHHDLESLSVQDEAGEIGFESKGIGPHGALFESKSKLKLFQHSPYKIRLINGKKKPLIEQLPLGTPAQMKPVELQPDEYFNEVFINV